MVEISNNFEFISKLVLYNFKSLFTIRSLTSYSLKPNCLFLNLQFQVYLSSNLISN